MIFGLSGEIVDGLRPKADGVLRLLMPMIWAKEKLGLMAETGFEPKFPPWNCHDMRDYSC
jgi:hypothetical protein